MNANRPDANGVQNAAASVLLDGCLVWISSSGHPTNVAADPGLRESEDERIEWPVNDVVQLGLSGVNDKHGVQLTGRRPAWDYAQLLKTFHYWPPKSIRKFDLTATKGHQPEADVKYVATVGLMCTMESGRRTSSKFLVKVSFSRAAIGIWFHISYEKLSMKNTCLIVSIYFSII